jgi:uncharacterized Tic20 family protein
MPRRKKAEEAISKVEAAPVESPPPAETSPAPAPAPAPEKAPVAAPVPVPPTLDERRMAAVAHGSILLNLVSGGFLGPIVALVVWLLYDRKSEYVSWHALQALVFQGLSLLLFLVLGVITALLWGVTALLMPIVIGFCLVPVALAFSVITAALVVGSLIYGCAGALAVLDGRDFRYRWVADWIPSLNRP